MSKRYLWLTLTAYVAMQQWPQPPVKKRGKLKLLSIIFLFCSDALATNGCSETRGYSYTRFSYCYGCKIGYPSESWQAEGQWSWIHLDQTWLKSMHKANNIHHSWLRGTCLYLPHIKNMLLVKIKKKSINQTRTFLLWGDGKPPHQHGGSCMISETQWTIML